MTPDAAVMKTESPVVDACQSERGRHERRRPHGRLVCAEERGDSAQIRSECDDGADVRREDAEGPVSFLRYGSFAALRRFRMTAGALQRAAAEGFVKRDR